MSETPKDATKDFTQSFDARDWAAAFVQHVQANPRIPTDKGTMIGWFANALMRGYDERARKEPTPVLAWAVERWHAEVANRPLVNVHRRTLDETWRQVIRHFGGDDAALCHSPASSPPPAPSPATTPACLPCGLLRRSGTSEADVTTDHARNHAPSAPPAPAPASELDLDTIERLNRGVIDARIAEVAAPITEDFEAAHDAYIARCEAEDALASYLTPERVAQLVAAARLSLKENDHA